MTRLNVEAVGVSIDDTRIVEAVSLEVSPGEVLGVVGPNGSGKSTLLRTVYRALRPSAGVVWVDRVDLWKMPVRKAAQRIAAVTQEATSDFDFSVREIVEMGRSPHKGLLDGDTTDDHTIVEHSLEQVGMAHLAGRVFATLSGGEKQRVLLARALAQQPEILVLDEPTNHLDVRAQFDLLELVNSLRITTIAALHELNLAARYCDRIVVLERGRLVTIGPIDEVLTPELIADVFGVHAHCGVHPVTGRLLLALSPLPGDRRSATPRSSTGS
jgi:iron complex transport system ATP-binding protein